MACDQEVELGRVSWQKQLTEKDIRPSWNKEATQQSTTTKAMYQLR